MPKTRRIAPSIIRNRWNCPLVKTQNKIKGGLPNKYVLVLRTLSIQGKKREGGGSAKRNSVPYFREGRLREVRMIYPKKRHIFVGKISPSHTFSVLRSFSFLTLSLLSSCCIFFIWDKQIIDICLFTFLPWSRWQCQLLWLWWLAPRTPWCTSSSLDFCPAVQYIELCYKTLLGRAEIVSAIESIVNSILNSCFDMCLKARY